MRGFPRQRARLWQARRLYATILRIAMRVKSA